MIIVLIILAILFIAAFVGTAADVRQAARNTRQNKREYRQWESDGADLRNPPSYMRTTASGASIVPLAVGILTLLALLEWLLNQ